MGISKVFVDSENTILAVHDESQGVSDDAYDALGIGETRVIYLDDEAIPKQEVVDGNYLPWKMPPGWWEDMEDVVPKSITGTQGKLVLHELGKLALVEAAIDGLPSDLAVPARIKWNAQNWYRADPLFDQVGQMVGMTTQEIDQAFILARDAA